MSWQRKLRKKQKPKSLKKRLKRRQRRSRRKLKKLQQRNNAEPIAWCARFMQAHLDYLNDKNANTLMEKNTYGI